MQEDTATMAVLQHLQSGKSITSKEAYDLYGVTRLSAIIYNLKDYGYCILTEKFDATNRFGRKSKPGRYKLVEREEF